MTWSIVDAARDGLATFALNSLIQSSALLTVGLLAGFFFRRKGAAVQSLIYRTTLAAILLCPIASALFASVGLGGFWVQFPVRPIRLVERRVESNLATASIVDGSKHDRDKLILPAKAAPQSVRSSMDQPSAPVVPSPAPARRAVVPARAGSLPHWADFVSATIWIGLGLWLSVSFLLLSRLVWGYRQLARIRSSAIPADVSTIALCRELADRMELDAPDVRLSPFLSTPCLFGVRRPTILLTEEDASGKREVLLHELAHLARRDTLWSLLRQVASALVWFQPLVWVLSRRLETSAEEVCDDFVVHSGADRSSYAGQLVDIAERMLAPVAPAGVGIVASRSSLARRVWRILDASRPLSIRSTRSGSAAIVAIGLTGTVLAALVGVGRAEPAAAVASSRPQVPGNETPPGQAVSFTGRLIDRESGEPVAGATIVVECTIPDCPPDQLPAWAGATTLRSDAEGRFTLAFTPEQVAEPRAAVTFQRVEHPDYVALRRPSVALINLVRDHRYGGKPFFETIRLDRGEVYRAEVVTPEGRPAAGVRYRIFRGGGSLTPLGTRSRDQTDWFENPDGVTDAQGRIHHRLALTTVVDIQIVPDDFAVYTKYFGTGPIDDRAPEVPLPPNLGRIELESGRVVIGRLLGLDGRPIAGQRLALVGGGAGTGDRIAITDADGSFRFPPIALGSRPCCVFAANQTASYWDRAPLMTADQPVIGRVATFDRGNGPIGPLALREVPSVRLDMRFVDAQGRPVAGRALFVEGFFPDRLRFEDETIAGDPEAKRLREEWESLERGWWGCRVAPDAEGRVSVRVPRGLNGPMFWVDAEFNTDETLTYQLRLGPDDVFDGGTQISDSLDADRGGIEYVLRRSPTVFARVVTDDGLPPPERSGLGVTSFDLSSWDGVHVGPSPIRMGPDRYRSRNLLPGREYEFWAWDPSGKYRPKSIVRRTLAEGVEEEINLVLTPQSAPLKVGDTLPDFSITTTSGERWTLRDHRGRFVFLYCPPYLSGQPANPPWVLDLRRRIGSDRLEILGLWTVPDPALPSKAEREVGTWPLAFLPDRRSSDLLWELGAQNSGVAFVLIDPEGRIRLFSWDVAEIEKAITGGE